VDGKIDWSGASIEWHRFGQIVMDVGLEWGGSWSPRFNEAGHFQYQDGSNPLKVMSKEDVAARFFEYAKTV